MVSAVAFSPDGSRIASDGDLFDVATGARLHELVVGYAVAFSPDGAIVAGATGYLAKGVRLCVPPTLTWSARWWAVRSGWRSVRPAS